MNKKGFTLVELLGVLIILSIIMLIAVPNVISILDKNKKNIFVADAKKIVSAVEYELSKQDKYPDTGACFVKLSDLSNIDLEIGPNDKKYNNESYINILKNNSKYEYKIYLTDSIMNINGIDSSALSKTSVKTGNINLTPSGNSCY